MSTTTIMMREKTEEELFCLSLRDLWTKKHWDRFLDMLENHYGALGVLQRMAKIDKFCNLFNREKNEDWIISGCILNIRCEPSSQVLVGTKDHLIFLSDFAVLKANNDMNLRFKFNIDYISHNEKSEEYLASESLLPTRSRVYYRYADQVHFNDQQYDGFDARILYQANKVFKNMQQGLFEICCHAISTKIDLAKQNSGGFIKKSSWQFSEADQVVMQYVNK